MRKALIVIGIILGSVILLFSGIIGVLHLKSVQTYIIGQVTNRLSEEWKVDVTVAQFHYRPLSHLVIDSIYLSDQQKDTLAYIEQVALTFNPLALEDLKLDIEQLMLKNPYLNIQHNLDSSLNCQFLLDIFKKDSVEFPLQVHVEKLQLQQTRLRYDDILVDQLDLALTLPILSKDSLDIYIESMHLRAQTDRLDASFEANLHGGLDSIFADNMLLDFRGETLFDGNLAVYHPMQLDSLYIRANCNQLYCNNNLFQALLAQLSIESIKLPTPITNLKYIHYAGDVDGRLDNMLLHGAFKTELGAMHVNGTVQINTPLQKVDFIGHISTQQFQLNKLLNHTDLGNIAFDAHVDGSIDSTYQLTHCIAEANVKHFDYLDYTYNNIHIDGEWNINEISGKLSINDDNLKLAISGLADWDHNDTRIDLNVCIDDFTPSTLHLSQKLPDLCIGANTYISLYTSGTPKEMLDNLNGYVIIDSLRLVNNKNAHTIEQIKVLIDSENRDQQPYHQIRIQSDFVTGNLSGLFSYSALPTLSKHILHKYIPILVPKPSGEIPQSTNLDFYAYFRELEQLTNILNLGIEVPSYPTIKGYLHNQQIGVQAFIPAIKTDRTQIKDITFALDNANCDKLNLSLYMLTHLPQDNPTAAKLGDIKTTFNISAANDNIDLNILLGNTDSVRNEGNINISSRITRFQEQPQLDIEIKPTHIVLNDSAWTISPTNLRYIHAKQCLDIHNLLLNTEYQSIKAEGRASKEKSDSINIQLNNINLNYLLSYTEANKVISVQGPVTGTATIYSVFSELMLEANANIQKGGINGVYLGDVTAEARLDRENKSIIIEGIVIDSTNHVVANVLGKVVPATTQWDLDIHCDSIDVNFINFWTQGIVSNPTGRAYGHVHVGGLKRDVWVTGAALAKDAHITIPQIGATYGFTDSVYLDSTAIRFPNIEVYDQYGNQGLFTGAVYHNNFMNIHFDLRAQANNLLVMDLPAEQQAFFYGKVFGTGDVHIYGDEMDCKIDVNARTEANTKFFLNINSASQASQSNFIHFIQPDTTSYGLLSLLQKPKISSPNNVTTQSKLRLSLQGEVTPQAEINIKLGAEDVIKGKGEGNLKLNYEYPSENVQMQGSYTLQSGQFSFSLGNIVRRNFTIREGSRITWDNDPMAPTLDITGHYHTTASLRDLFGSESAQIATNRTSVPVNCVLNMSDQLFNPIMKFAIELPQSDESVQSQVNSMINTEEMLMRQIIYLLVFNRFYTPEYLQNTQNVGLNETYSLLSSTLTGQINSWLSKLTDVFTMGFNFRTDGEGETASQEYEANFQIHPINQLIINGNFGYRYNDLSNRPFFGDLDVEYLLTENGKLRAKAYTHTVDKYSLRQANTVQGVGFVFKHDFNWGDRKKKVQNDSSSTKTVKTKQKKKKQ